MRRARTSIVAALASAIILSVAGTSLAAEIGSVFVDHGVAGDSVSLLGTGFGDRKGKVSLAPDGGGRRARVRIENWTDTSVRVRIRRAAPGPATFTLKVRGGDAPTAPFTVDEPSLGWEFDNTGGLGPNPAARGSVALVLVRGGGNKPKITVGGQRVRIKRAHKLDPFGWIFRVPNLADGQHTVVAKTKYGTLTSEPGEGLFVLGDDEELGDTFVELTLTDLDGSGDPIPGSTRTERIARRNLKASVNNWTGLFQLDLKRPGGPTIQFGVGGRFDTRVPLPTLAFYPQYFGGWITYSEVGGRSRTDWSSDRGTDTDHLIRVTETGGGQIAGEFSATMSRLAGTDAPRDLLIEGTFRVHTGPRVR